MWSTLVLNMHARYFVLNCGSNWHSLIRRLRSSCGASPATVFCLNSQHPQAPFFVCDQKWQTSHVEACANKTQATLDSLHQAQSKQLRASKVKGAIQAKVGRWVGQEGGRERQSAESRNLNKGRR